MDGKILIVDDEQGIRDLLRFELGTQGYTVVTAAHGEEGLECIAKEPFRVVITDLKMPKVDGMHLLEAVRKQHPGTKVIVITGYGSPEVEKTAIARGAFCIIQKPFNLDVLSAAVCQAVAAES